MDSSFLTPNILLIFKWYPPIKAPYTPGVDKICIFNWPTSLLPLCIDLHELGSDMQHHQQRWSSIQVLFVELPAHLKACSHRRRKGLRQNVLLRLTRSVWDYPVSLHQKGKTRKGKPIWIYWSEIVSGSGISWAISKSVP